MTEHSRHAAAGSWTTGRLLRVGTLSLVAVVFAVPIVTFILMSFRQEDAIGNVPGGIYAVTGLSLENLFRNLETILAFNSGIYLKWLQNSLVVATAATALAVFTAVPAGYAIAKLRFRGDRCCAS